MRNRIIICAFVFALAPFVVSTAFAQGIMVVPNVGISKDMRSLTSNRWKWGFNVGVDGFLQLFDVLLVGGRASYHSWSMDPEGWAEDVLSGTTGIQSSSGSQSAVELIPSLRLAFFPAQAPVRIDIQFGAGLVFVSHSEVKVRRTTFFGWEEGTTPEKSMVGTALQAALPITIANVIELLPLYTLYAADGDPYHHIALNIGVALGR